MNRDATSSPVPAWRHRSIVVFRRLSSTEDVIELAPDWRPKRARERRSTAALWIPTRALAFFFARLEREPSIPWSTLRFHHASGGIVLLDVLPRWTIFGVGVPLIRIDAENRSEIFCDRGIEPPSFLRHVTPDCGPPDRGPWLAVTCDGVVRLARLEARARPVFDLFTVDARPDSTRDARRVPSSIERQGSTDQPLDLCDDDAASEISDWLVEKKPDEVDDRELGGELARAFSESSIEDTTPPDVRVKRPGWLRVLVDRTLPEATRRRLDEKGERRVSDDKKRARVVRRQGKALSALLRKLAGPDWRDGLRLGLPLREPGEKEKGARWLSPDPTLRARAIDFNIGTLEAKAAYGSVPVGSKIFRQFRGFYQRAAERLVQTREFRQAAHVFSYLLGDHVRAGAVLEQAGFSREAATVYYHLAERPRRAAVALTRASLHAEAARIWMDLREWRQAAESWERARDSSQASAAWRKVAVDLHHAGRLVESAEIRRDRLGERVASLEILELCVRRLDRHWRVALRRALDDCVDLGDPDRARAVIRLAIESCDDAIAERPRRSAFQNALELVEDVARWEKRGRRDRIVDVEQVRRVWEGAIESWSACRADFAPLPRGELDRKLCAVARAVADAIEDPWLADDVCRWVDSDRTDRDPERGSSQTSTRALARRPTALARADKRIVLGDEDGRIVVLDENLESVNALGELDTRTARPVSRIALLGDDIYAAVDSEIFHFVGDGTASAPLQIERSLDGVVQDLIAFPDRSALLRLSTRDLHVLHPLHLRPIARVLEARARTFVAVACNRRYVAVLSRLDDATEDPSVRARYEVDLLHRRDRTAPGLLREVERFVIDLDRAVRIELSTRSGGDPLIVGDEHLVVVPTRREAARYFELDVAARAGHVQAARVQTARQGEVVMIAYADGSLERIEPRTGDRRYVAEAIGDGEDPLVGFVMREAPTVAWLAHASGGVRRVEV